MDSPIEKSSSRLEVRGLSGSVFRDVSLSLAAGECVALTGPSGSGKSVLLRAIVDLDPNAGEVLLDGESRAGFTPSAWRRALALVPAEPAWWAERVVEHFSHGAEPDLPELGLPAEALDWEVARCSSGERQRLALLRSLALAPRVLLLDEPTANLDADSRGRVETLVDKFRGEGGAVLWVTHDPEQALRVAGRRLELAKGGLSPADVETEGQAWA
ncbi:MAG: ATP-binding cassette domain-containing protein [Acidihalobacter sp.]|uniref:ABC transporter ATP-binding protein n=1 Tax=Acidihalobacter sp. TaxID=1872108 RepID=UPI00307F8417